MGRLNIFIDESGDFGFSKGHAMFYVISFVIHDPTNDITPPLKHLNLKLNNISHDGMVHLGDLIHGNNSYKDWSIEERKKVLWATINFASSCDIKVHSIVIDRNFVNTEAQLNRELFKGFSNLVNKASNLFKKYEKIRIYYDQGQKQLGVVIDGSFLKYEVERVSAFDKNEKRLFQVADMLTYVDKTISKYNSKIKLSKTEEKFFSKPGTSIKKTIKQIDRKLKSKRV